MYIHFSLNISDPTLITEIKITFNISDGSSYDSDSYYCSFQPSTLAPVVANSQTTLQALQNQQVQNLITQRNQLQAQLDALTQNASLAGIMAGGLTNFTLPAQIDALNQQIATLLNTPVQSTDIAAPGPLEAGSVQWTEILIPISSLIYIGNDNTRTLSNCSGVQISINCTAAVTVKLSSFWVGGGGEPDVGDQGAPYMYRAVPRNTIAGVMGNPSSMPLYGLNPRRQNVKVTPPSAAYDSQIDIWDIYRYGGTVTSWNRIGSCQTGSYLIDRSFDDSALAGAVMQTDNFEPWPSIDTPFLLTSSTATIKVCGDVILVSGYSGGWPSTIANWLPGTLIEIGGQKSYTLWCRPIYVSSTSYLFVIQECAGYLASASSFKVVEPKVARQICPYLWGQDERGYFFGCGDPLRPGTLYYCKPYNPDSAPDTNNLEISPPSEPIIGGVLLSGLSYAASTKRWWALYPTSSYYAYAQGLASQATYTALERPVGRGLVSHSALCTDGTFIYFLAKDGICITQGSGFKSLTDATLYKLFPHEGIAGSNITRNGDVYYAPDYKYAASFRLSIVNKYLYFDYCDSTNTRHTLTFDTRDVVQGWSLDVYHDPISVHYGVEQQSGTLITATPADYAQEYVADTNGYIWKQAANHNDNLTAIPVSLATFEWNGDEFRANLIWNDLILNCLPSSAVSVTPVSGGTGIVAATVISASSTRATSIINIGTSAKYVGALISWTDDFTSVSTPTTLYFWQPLFEPLPIQVNIWTPEGTGFGLPGYKTIPRMVIAYRANATVTLTITAYDGTSPTALSLPSTSGAYQKAVFTLTPNKGMLYTLSASCSAAWTPYLDEWEIYVGQWGRSGPCQVFKGIPPPKGVG